MIAKIIEEAAFRDRTFALRDRQPAHKLLSGKLGSRICLNYVDPLKTRESRLGLSPNCVHGPSKQRLCRRMIFHRFDHASHCLSATL